MAATQDAAMGEAAPEGDKASEAPAVAESAEAPAEDAARESAATAEAGEPSAAEAEKAAEAEAEAEGEEAAPAEEAPAEEPEKEEDAPADSRPRLAAGAVAASGHDCTLTAMQVAGGKLLTAFRDGGLQHLCAAARATAGVKAGRYYYEVRILELRKVYDRSGAYRGRGGPQQHSCCLGFSTAGSSLFLGEEGVGFDMDGNYLVEGKKKMVCAKLLQSQVFGILVNLDASSANANTVSLFCDGVRACKPQPIPEQLKGKALYPTVNYKGMTLQLHFGPTPLQELPFKCRMIQDAAQADVELAPAPASKAKPEVLVPIGLPDEGTYDWLDGYLKKHPEYTELSNRSVLEWGLKSGLHRQRGSSRSCNDHPNMDFNVRELDDGTARAKLQVLAPSLRRDVVSMEVKSNLFDKDRKAIVEKFGSDYKKVAVVVMGEPPESYKKERREALLARRRAKAESDAREHYKVEQKKDKGEKEDEKKETLEEAVKKAVDAVELTAEEQKASFLKPYIEDLTQKDLSCNFAWFTLPTKEEGFDEIRYEWAQESACQEYLKAWIHERKLTQRFDDLQPGEWFQKQSADWNRLVGSWRRTQGQWRDPARRGELQRRKKDSKDAGEKKEEKKEPEKKEEEDAQKEKPDQDMEEGAEKEAPAEGETEAKESEPMEIDAASLDVFNVEDVCDIGNGEPLFAHFTWEDWMLLNLRFDLHLLVHAYRKDIDDAERTCFHESHLYFYYNKYYKRQLTPKNFGVNSTAELLEFVKDTIEMTPKSLLDSLLSEDTPLDNFLRITEDTRRDRLVRIDAGDEDAVLKFQRQNNKGDKGGGRDYGHGGQYQRNQYGHDRGQAAPSRGGPPPPPSHGGKGGGKAPGASRGYDIPRGGPAVGGDRGGYASGPPRGAPPAHHHQRGGGGGYGAPPPPVGHRSGPGGPPTPYGYAPPPPPPGQHGAPPYGQRRPYPPGPPGGDGGYGPPPHKAPRTGGYDRPPSHHAPVGYGAPPPAPRGGYGGGGHRSSGDQGRGSRR
eukprot:TRINITY_DN79_c0_g1_i4.p1 TRINITY_DN79_c0_g1~~TRINITY_DN79_c0_g1_i4.p1  ORF type:complete len:1012 (+),score=290.12 TRINITY_DN79_c0_g1_i4:68-3103(+)